MTPALRLGVVGFGLVAVCYGFARFAFGLFLPRISEDLSLGATFAGIVSGGSYLGFCLAILASSALTERIGARAVALGAALLAALGMGGIALAPGPLWLAAAVFAAGSSTGLASPPMAAAVAASVRPDLQDADNTAINAGSGAGVALAGAAAILLAGDWRFAFAAFTAVALLASVATARMVPAARGGSGAAQGMPPFGRRLANLVAAAFLMGAASTALWSFGGELARLRLGWGSTGVGVLWVVAGAAGIAGAFAGSLVSRFGIDRVHRLSLLALAGGIALAGTALATPAATLGGGALFGAAYVMLSGTYLVWGVSALPDRPATGLMIGFLTVAAGQTVGAPLFGLLLDRLGPDAAAVAFAALGVAAGAARSASGGRRLFRKRSATFRQPR